MIKKNEEFVFTSERLGYRLIHESDFDSYFKLDSDPQVREFFPKNTLNAEQVKSNIKKNIEFFDKNNFGVFIAIELSTGELIGRCGFGEYTTGEIEVGYVFFRKFWGKGLATEALFALLEWAEHNIHVVDHIIALTPIHHIASERVMQKAGMKFLRKEMVDGTDCVIYQYKLRNDNL